MKQFMEELIKIIKSRKPSKQQLSKIKTKLSKKYRLKKIPTDIEVLLNAPIKEIPKIKKYIITKPTRTISGVSVCAVMTKPFKCPHTNKGGPCIMCPGGPNSVFGNVPQSYTGKEPATRRAIRNNYDPYLQVMNRLEQYIVQGHIPDKLELIVMGGTFPSFPKRYKENFITYAFKAMNDFSLLFFKKNQFDFTAFKDFFELPGDIFSQKRTKRIHEKLDAIKKIRFSKANSRFLLESLASGKKLIEKNNTDDFLCNKNIRLEKALKKQKKETAVLMREQSRNETASIRCISLVIETRPDYATLKHANEMLRLGCTKVELGVQTLSDKILKKIRRGHTVEDSIKATKILKDLGFKINYHIMLGLPGVTKENDEYVLKSLFAFDEFQPDMLKLYPCMVLRGTKLYKLWKQKKYKPLTTRKAAEIISKFKKVVPEYVRIMRVQRDIPTFMTEAGVDKTNLRQYIEEIMKKKKIKCRCIRCREPKLKKISKKITILERHYNASGGNEFFISAEDKKNDLILGFCRLRFPSQSLRKEITKSSALIRELHVYGEAAQIGTKGRIQHKGIGKALIKRAEDKAKMYFRDKIVVIAGIGARGYFKNLGYKKQGPYMVKNIR
jgi:elongator complex protein 3